jgi:chemotaxis protein CheX
MDSALISAFVYSLEKMMGTMLGSPCRSSGSAGPESAGSYVSGVVYFTGGAEGRMALSFARRTAQQVVADMLGIKPAQLTDAMVQDGVAEMANIVAGNAKSLLADTRHRVSMSLPRVVLGQSFHPGSRPIERAHYRSFDSPHGTFSLALWMMPKDAADPE